MKYTKDTAKKVLNYLNNNPEFKQQFLSWNYDEQKTSVKLLLALKKI